MRNPLHKRFKRQVVHDAGKYLGIFALLLVTASLVSCFLMCNSSILSLLDDQFATSSIEDARIETQIPLTSEQKKLVADHGAEVVDLFSRETHCYIDGNDVNMRIFEDRTTIDTATYYEGSAPESADEIALDDTFATVHGLTVGSTIEIDSRTFIVCGLMVLPDYVTLLESNNDLVMNTITFCVGLVSSEGFEEFSNLPTSYTYALRFDDADLSLSQRISLEEEIAKDLIEDDVELVTLLDREQNRGINYASDDMQGDSKMYLALGYILVCIMAFVFIILTNATIEKEASVIGTLLASGWRKSEIVRHYLFLPAFVGFVALALGTILGYTVLVGPISSIYYNSYSFPPFHPHFDLQAFILTSVIPYFLLLAIMLIGLVRKLKATPLAFLRHEVSRPKRHRSIELPASWKFILRFRMRLALRNLPSFAILFFGICAGNILLIFGLGILPIFENYAYTQAASVPANYIYTLKAPYELTMTEEQQHIRDELEDLLDMEEGINELRSGGQTLDQGSQQLEQGIHSATEGSSSLAQRFEEFNAGLRALVQGDDAYAAGLAQSAEQQARLGDSIDMEALQADYGNALANYIHATSVAMSAGIDPFSSQEVQIAYANLTNSLTSLVSGAGKKGGAEGAAKALDQARESYQQIVQSSNALATASSALSKGSQQLSSGMELLDEGSAELASGMSGYRQGIEALLSEVHDQGLGEVAESLVDNLHPVAEEETNSREAIDQTEKLCIASFEADRPNGNDVESLTVYGIQPDSRYWNDIDVSQDRNLIGEGLAEKFDLEPGDVIVLYDKYNDVRYALAIDGLCSNPTNTNIYMSKAAFNETFGHNEYWFNGYASNEELVIDKDYWADTTTPEDMIKVADQMMSSFSKVVSLIIGIALLVFFVVMYLLTKTVLDYSARSISYMKVFGYRDREVNRLYLTPLTVMVIVSLILSLPLVLLLITSIFKAMLLSYPGNFIIEFSPSLLCQCLLLGFATYLAVALLHVRHLRRIPLALALKIQE